MNTVIISPHIDDAVLSLGGLVHELVKNKQKVIIEYVFSISDFINNDSVSGLHCEGDLHTVTALRKEEEELVCKLLGYDYNFMNCLDAPLRADKHEENLSKDIKNKLASRISKSDRCYFPFGLSHPDHIIMRSIGLDFLNEGYDIFFYEDMPYMAAFNLNLRSMYNICASIGLKPHCLEIDFTRKCDALMLYSSQVSYDWIKDISNYSYCVQSNTYYERYWEPANKKIRF